MYHERQPRISPILEHARARAHRPQLLAPSGAPPRPAAATSRPPRAGRAPDPPPSSSLAACRLSSLLNAPLTLAAATRAAFAPSESHNAGARARAARAGLLSLALILGGGVYSQPEALSRSAPLRPRRRGGRARRSARARRRPACIGRAAGARPAPGARRPPLSRLFSAPAFDARPRSARRRGTAMRGAPRARRALAWPAGAAGLAPSAPRLGQQDICRTPVRARRRMQVCVLSASNCIL